MSYRKQMFEVGDLVQWNGVEDPNFSTSKLGIVVRAKPSPISPPDGGMLYQVIMNDWGKEMWFEERALCKKA